VSQVSSTSAQDPKQQFDVLLADYESCREDERSLSSAMVTAFSIAVTLIGVMAAAVTQTCQFSGSQGCTHVPDYVLAASPTIPIALLTYVTMLGIGATLRSFYIRGLEKRLQEYSFTPFLGELIAPSIVGVTVELTSLRRGNLAYRIIANFMMAIVLLIFGGYTAYVGFHVSKIDQIIMAVIYSGTASLLVWIVTQGTIRGRKLFAETASRFLDNPGNNVLPEPAHHKVTQHVDERPLASYLIFPRPEDWIKWTIIPGVFATTAWSTGTFDHWPTFLALWLILEYLIYNARYQWNDIRGAVEDQSNGQRRLPIGFGHENIRRNILVSMGVALLRLAAAAALAITFHLTGPVFLLMALVFSIAVLYEALRAAELIDSAQLPGYLRRIHARPIAAWCIVGLGYGVRAGLGFIVGGLPIRSWEAIAGIALFVSFGIMFVLMTWTLGATDYCAYDQRNIWYWQRDVVAKPHIVQLLRFIPKLEQELTAKPSHTVVASDLSGGAYSKGRRERILLKYNAPRAPWNLAFAVSLAFGSFLGPELAHARHLIIAFVIELAVTLVGSYLLVTVTSQRRHPDGIMRNSDSVLLLAVITVGTVAIACAAGFLAPLPKALIMAIPWPAISFAYVGFCNSSLQDLQDFTKQIMEVLAAVKEVKAVGPFLANLVVGKKTWTAFTAQSSASSKAASTGGRQRP